MNTKSHARELLRQMESVTPIPVPMAYTTLGSPKSAVQTHTAASLLTAYGGILENHPGVVSEKLLPSSKQDIKQALVADARAAFRSHDGLALDLDRVVYGLLSNFRPDDEAELMSGLNSRVHDVTADTRSPELVGRELVTPEFIAAMEKCVDIAERQHDELMGLILEFDLLVYKQETSDAIAFEKLTKAALHGDAESRYRVGRTYHAGTDVPKDVGMAAYWFGRAAEQGHADAQNMMGLYCSEGLGVPKDSDKANEWFTKSAEQGNASAQCSLGMRHHGSTDEPKDTTKAIYWLTKSAEQGDVHAQYYLASLYDTEFKSEKNAITDYAKAAYWWAKAAEHENDHAQNRLAQLCAAGTGVPQDYYAAFKWYTLAYNRDDAKLIAHKLTLSQVAKALEEVEAWRIGHGYPSRAQEEAFRVKCGDGSAGVTHLISETNPLATASSIRKTQSTAGSKEANKAPETHSATYEIYDKTAYGAGKNIAFEFLLAGFIYWLSTKWHLGAQILFWMSLIVSAMAGLQTLVRTVCLIVMAAWRKIGHGPSVPKIKGVSWLFGAAIVRWIELAVGSGLLYFLYRHIW